MKCASQIRGDDGQVWEVEYEEHFRYAEEDGELVRDEDGMPVSLPSTVHDFKFRKQGDETWTELPNWATVKPGAAINLCFFDEDDEDGSLTLWQVNPSDWD